MNVEEIKRLPAGEKIQIMEAIWDDLRERYKGFELSSEDKVLLEERRERVSNGASQLKEWDAVKDDLGSS